MAPSGDRFEWRNLTGTFSLQHYKEAKHPEDDGYSVLFDNRHYVDGTERDTIRTESTSPSAPQGVDLHLYVEDRPTDAAFLDVTHRAISSAYRHGSNDQTRPASHGDSRKLMDTRERI